MQPCMLSGNAQAEVEVIKMGLAPGMVGDSLRAIQQQASYDKDSCVLTRFLFLMPQFLTDMLLTVVCATHIRSTAVSHRQGGKLDFGSH